MNWFKRLFSTCPPIDAPEIELNKSSLPPNFTVLDIETTGLNPKKNEILEIGAIRYRGGFEARHFHTYVRPSRPIPEYISDINGITWDIVSGAPVFAQIKDRFFSFIGNDTLVGYNNGNYRLPPTNNARPPAYKALSNQGPLPDQRE